MFFCGAIFFGYIMAQLGRIPAVGDEVEIDAAGNHQAPGGWETFLVNDLNRGCRHEWKVLSGVARSPGPQGFRLKIRSLARQISKKDIQHGESWRGGGSTDIVLRNLGTGLARGLPVWFAAEWNV
jgi:hypothetical protein